MSKGLTTIFATAVFSIVAITTMHITEDQSTVLYDYQEYSEPTKQSDFKAYKPNSRSVYTDNSIHYDFKIIDNNILNSSSSSTNKVENNVDNSQSFNQHIITTNSTKSSISSHNNAVSSAVGMGAYALASTKNSSNAFQSFGSYSGLRASSSDYVPFEDAGPQKSPNGWDDDDLGFVDPGGEPEGDPLPIGNGLLILLGLGIGYMLYLSRFKVFAKN